VFDASSLKDGEYYVISFDITNVSQGSISWKNIQLEEGTSATEYTPYKKYGFTSDYTPYLKVDVDTFDEFKNYIVNKGPIGIYTVYLNVDGGVTACIVLKASNKYLSFIRFGYSINATQYKYFDGTWSELSL
jgi:hypothetical protein